MQINKAKQAIQGTQDGMPTATNDLIVLQMNGMASLREWGKVDLSKFGKQYFDQKL